GESMFFTIPDGSKVAMVKLVEWLRSQNFLLFDAQMMNPHLERFGAYAVESEVYEDILYQAVQLPCRFLPPSISERKISMMQNRLHRENRE
ncbi:MAG: leucyl/phenylalanyl-tRNA--protein transferase, partial [Cyanobacteria bacterium P01_H01_bin.105]